MKNATKTLEVKVERIIPAPADEVYAAWLNPNIPGNPWHAADKLILNPEVDGFFYWKTNGTSHYGRFTEMERPNRIQHTWVSPNTLGEESTVTVTFTKQGEDTLMTLLHADLPDTAKGKAHEDGWNFFLAIFPKQFGDASGMNKNYTATIEVSQSPKDVFNHLKEVSKWWNKDIEGSSTQLDDEFIVRHGDLHYSKQKLIELIPEKKIVWLVTDSKLNWLEKDKNEWTNTEMVFEITAKGDKTVLQFTHKGLVPENECYAKVAESWDLVINGWLFNFITEGKAI